MSLDFITKISLGMDYHILMNKAEKTRLQKIIGGRWVWSKPEDTIKSWQDMIPVYDYLRPVDMPKTDEEKYLYAHSNIIRILLTSASLGTINHFIPYYPIFSNAWNLYVAYRWLHYTERIGYKAEFYTKTYFLDATLEQDGLSPAQVYSIATDNSLRAREIGVYTHRAEFKKHMPKIKYAIRNQSVRSQTDEEAFNDLLVFFGNVIRNPKMIHDKLYFLTTPILLRTPELVNAPYEKVFKEAKKVLLKTKNALELPDGRIVTAGFIYTGWVVSWYFWNSFMHTTAVASDADNLVMKWQYWTPGMLSNVDYMKLVQFNPAPFVKVGEYTPNTEQRDLYRKMFKLFYIQPQLEYGTWRIANAIYILAKKYKNCVLWWDRINNAPKNSKWEILSGVFKTGKYSDIASKGFDIILNTRHKAILNEHKEKL